MKWLWLIVMLAIIAGIVYAVHRTRKAAALAPGSGNPDNYFWRKKDGMVDYSRKADGTYIPLT